MLFLVIFILVTISYYGYKIFSNLDYFISNYSNEKLINHLHIRNFTAFITVTLCITLIGVIFNQISILLKKVKHLTWNEFIKDYTHLIDIEHSIKILFFFIIGAFFCCYSAFQMGKLISQETSYHIGYYQKQQVALIKSMKNGIGIFVPINKDKKYKKEHFLLLQLGEAAVNFTEQSKIKQIQN